MLGLGREGDTAVETLSRYENCIEECGDTPKVATKHRTTPAML